MTNIFGEQIHMRTLGIDLAAEPKGTATTVIEWSATSATVLNVSVGVTDDVIVQLALGAQKVGIDCALGWPQDFIAFLSAQENLETVDEIFDGGLDWRRQLAFRETDRQVRATTGRWPLSVATDRLGMTALRCSGLLTRLKQAGIDVDRTGTGHLVEVYPGVSLRLWGFDSTGYRNSAEIRRRLLDSVMQQLPGLDVGDSRDLLLESCDAFDSLVAALATRSAALGFYEPPHGKGVEVARTEGWIALPNRAINDLLYG